MNRPIASIGTRRRLKRPAIAGVAAVITVTAFVQFSTPEVRADKFDDQIRAIQQEIDQYQTKAQELKKQSNSLEKELAQLSTDTKVIQGQIDLSQAKYDKLQVQIVDTQKKIDTNRDALGLVVSDIYIEGSISPLEMLASSKNIGEYLDKSSYRASISENLTNMIAQIRESKEELDNQQKEVTRVLSDQKLAKSQLAKKVDERKTLLEKTKGDESEYKTLVAKREDQKGELHRQHQAAIESAMNRGNSGSFSPTIIGDSSKGGYPWEAGCWVNANAWSYGGANGNGTDPLGYGCRQCVSYTAHKVGQRTGNYPRYWGNANMWPASARSAGYKTGSTPRANSVGIIMAGQFGHSAWIESVNSDGTLTISQYNFYNAGGPGWGNYSKMKVPASAYDVFIYF